MAQSQGFEAVRGQTFSIALRTAITAASEGIFEIIAKSKRLRLLYFQASLQTAVAGQMGIARSSTKGVTPTEVQMVSSVGSGRLSDATCAVAWGGARPAFAANTFMRRFSTSTGLGSGATYEFDELYIPPGTTLSLFNANAGGLTGIWDVCVTVEELPY